MIRARKLHHSRFFALTLDYGHQHYLDKLSSQKYIILRALERLERRTAEVLFEDQKWFKWVRECQDTEEAQRDNEKKKVKQEAAMFRRHQKELQIHIKEQKSKEYIRRQEAELEKAYLERVSEQEREEREAEWDPIEDVMEDERGTYTDLIKNFLFMNETSSGVRDASLEKQSGFSAAKVENCENDSQGNKEDDPAKQSISTGQADGNVASVSSDGQSTAKSKKSKKKAATNEASQTPLDKSLQETPSQIRRRLKEGVKLSYSAGLHLSGSIDNPTATKDKTAPLPDEEIDKILGEIAEIKLLLFCRLLLSHATLLPNALRASSVQEFLDDSEVTDADLRDLCLKMDNPDLQEIRDACADLGRGENEPEESEDDMTEEELDSEEEAERKVSDRLKRLRLYRKQDRKIPKAWTSKREEQTALRKKTPQQVMPGMDAKDLKNSLIDFGEIDDGSTLRSRKIRVKVCGKYIYNYPSERAVSRGGWLHFCVIAKGSDLHDAIRLCRHWDEFWELNILSIFQYFPAAHWLEWKGDRLRQQLLMLVSQSRHDTSCH